MSTTHIVLIALGLWLGCSVLAYAITFAYFDREYPESADKLRSEHAVFGLYVGMYGPIGLVMAFALSGCAKHGLKFRK